MPPEPKPHPEGELTALFGAPPPRPVPRLIRARGKALAAPLRRLWLGLLAALLGIVLGYGAGLRGWMEDRQLDRDDGSVARSRGRITAVKALLEPLRRPQIFRYSAQFAAADSVKRDVRGFTSDLIYRPGAMVEVEYLRTKPALSRIVATRRALMPDGIFLLLLCGSVAGLVVAVWTLRARRRAVWMLVHGEAAQGKIRDIELIKSSKVILRNSDPNLLSPPVTTRDLARRLEIERVEQGDIRGYLVKFHYVESAFRTYAQHLSNHRAAGILEARRAAGQPVLMVRDPSDPERFMFVEPLFNRD